MYYVKALYGWYLKKRVITLSKQNQKLRDRHKLCDGTTHE